jgi:hypothetical protein
MRNPTHTLVLMAALTAPLPLLAEATLAPVPVFSQLVIAAVPEGFTVAGVALTDAGYSRTAALPGETPHDWTQQVLLNADRDLVAAQNVTPVQYADYLAGIYQNGCPASFVFENLSNPEDQLGGYPIFAYYIACGAITGADGSPDLHAEQLIVVSVAGAKDIYTMQWLERAPMDIVGKPYDSTLWQPRMAALTAGFKLCDPVAGEAAPYPSCTQ